MIVTPGVGAYELLASAYGGQAATRPQITTVFQDGAALWNSTPCAAAGERLGDAFRAQVRETLQSALAQKSGNTQLDEGELETLCAQLNRVVIAAVQQALEQTPRGVAITVSASATAPGPNVGASAAKASSGECTSVEAAAERAPQPERAPLP